MSILLIAPVLALVLLALLLAALYNGLVKLRAQVDNGWAQIQVQLQRRLDLIPNLVETVKGYAQHERETLDAVITARNAGLGAATPVDQAASSDLISGALTRLFALSENYPQLKADANFRQLQDELTSTEDRVAYSRQFYNDSVTRFNTKIATIPTLFVARMFGFTARELFQAPAEARHAPKVEF